MVVYDLTLHLAFFFLASLFFDICDEPSGHISMLWCLDFNYTLSLCCFVQNNSYLFRSVLFPSKNMCGRVYWIANHCNCADIGTNTYSFLTLICLNKMVQWWKWKKVWCWCPRSLWKELHNASTVAALKHKYWQSRTLKSQEMPITYVGFYMRVSFQSTYGQNAVNLGVHDQHS